MGYKENFKNYQKDEISLFSLISTLKREKNLIFLITLISSIFVMSYAHRIKPIWLGQFNIVVKDNSEKSSNPLANLGIGSNTDEKITQYINDYVTFDWIYLILVLFFSILFSQKLLVKDSV